MSLTIELIFGLRSCLHLNNVLTSTEDVREKPQWFMYKKSRVSELTVFIRFATIDFQVLT